MWRRCSTLLAVIGIAGGLLLGACGGDGPEPEPEEVAGSRLPDAVASKLAAALGLEGHEQGTPPIEWEGENTSAWRDAELFANRILGEIEVPSLEEMQISVVTDETVGSERRVVVRVQVAGLTADYWVSMREDSGQWRVTAYEVAEIAGAVGR
jgi:hypothetical protein